MSRARSLSRLANEQALSVSADLNVGINSTSPVEKLNVVGVVSATSFVGDSFVGDSFVGDGSQLTGVSGFATALSSDSSSLLNRIFKTPRVLDIGAGTSIKVVSDSSSGDIAFCREGSIHVAVGGTFHVGSGTTLITNVLGVF